MTNNCGCSWLLSGAAVTVSRAANAAELDNPEAAVPRAERGAECAAAGAGAAHLGHRLRSWSEQQEVLSADRQTDSTTDRTESLSHGITHSLKVG